MTDRGLSRWRELYTAAYLERNPTRLTECIDQAERAIMQCQQEITTRPEKNQVDRRTLEMCLQDLRVLRQREGAAPAEYPVDRLPSSEK
jgi:hypothetical protein